MHIIQKPTLQARTSQVSSLSRTFLFSLMLTAPLLLTACNQPNQSSKPSQSQQSSTERQDKHETHQEHDEHAEHQHDAETHTTHQHEHTEHGDQHEHSEHGHQHEHEAEHTHEHSHQHSTSEKQTIPDDYVTNFVVSNHPLFLLSEVVTQGTPTTVLKLLGAGDVGHHGSLSPSDIKALKDSNYVVWFGESLESNLSNTLKTASNSVTVLDNKELTLLERRNEQGEVIQGNIDPHIWLDPNNAKIIVNQLAKLHIETNPKYADIYTANAEKFSHDIDEVVARHHSSDNKKYWGSHDAFQYLEAPLNIKLAGTLTTDHEIPAKASQILWLNKNRPYETMCLLAQSEPKEGIKNKLAPVKTAVLVEDLSNSSNFLHAWESTAKAVESCVIVN